MDPRKSRAAWAGSHAVLAANMLLVANLVGESFWVRVMALALAAAMGRLSAVAWWESRR